MKLYIRHCACWMASRWPNQFASVCRVAARPYVQSVLRTEGLAA